MSAPNLKEIEWAIAELKQSESSERRYITLAALYIVRDHLGGQQDNVHLAPVTRALSIEQEQTVGEYGKSDFLRAVEGKEPSAAWRVMDELMETLYVVNPRVYDGVMRKMERI